MEISREVLERCPLFAQISAAQAWQLLDELNAGTRTYACGEALVLAGYENHSIGIVLDERSKLIKPSLTAAS